MEKENYIYLRRRKRRKIFAEGKYIIFAEEKEKEKIFAEGKYICFAEEKQKEKIFGEGQYIFFVEKKNGEGKGRKYVARENVTIAGAKKGKKLLGQWTMEGRLS